MRCNDAAIAQHYITPVLHHKQADTKVDSILQTGTTAATGRRNKQLESGRRMWSLNLSYDFKLYSRSLSGLWEVVLKWHLV